ncbi:MAG: AbrB/MazE/SpoVT family DNA-binding domain-containing protein [Coriobacteriales bacterium]|jgi:antitoxin MazE|nr:AbrB/MazE/SpoVT family DNA-binding domain-containing protein [Coriobacteriales bacterium]
MGNTVTVSKWGNAQGVRLPKAFCDLLDISVGDKVQISVESKRIVIEKPDEQFTLQARMRNWDGKRYEAPEIDWGKPAGQEVW